MPVFGHLISVSTLRKDRKKYCIVILISKRSFESISGMTFSQLIFNLILKLANTLGFKNFAEYTLTTSCAKKPENVETFLNNLTDKIKILQQKEMDALLEYKKQEVYLFLIPFR